MVGPAPGLLIVIVFPIPVSLSGSEWDVPIEFDGLKYISLSCITGKLDCIPAVNVNTLGISSRIVDWVWDTPTASTGLKTLIREERLSTSNTFTISVETPTWYRSFVLMVSKSPSTLKKVTIPVAPAVPIPCVRIRRFEVIPTSYDPAKFFLVVDKPPTLTTTPFCKLIEVDAIPTNVSSIFLKNLIPVTVSFVTLIPDIDPFNFETLALALEALSIFGSKTTTSFIW